jgi:hypothetical protein
VGLDDGVCNVTADGLHVWQLQGVALGVDPGPVAATGVDAEYECAGCGTVMLRTPGQPFPGTV